MFHLNNNCIKYEWSRISQKRLVIYGTGNSGKIFYDKYRFLLPVYACTSSEKNTIPIENLKVISYQELNSQTDFLIICSVAYEEIRQRLILDGWEVNYNFMSAATFEVFFDNASKNKQLIVAIGQCEIREIFEILLRIKEFNERYSVLYYDERKVCIHGNKKQIEEAVECINMLPKADYFVRPSVLNPTSMMSYNFFQEKLKKDCETIVVSLFYFDSYFPQDIYKERQVSKYYVTKPGVKLCAYVESDRVVDKLLEENIPCSEIMKIIVKDDLFSCDEVIKNHKDTLRRIMITDRVSDIKVADFVADNYNKVKLYCDRGHFNQELLREYAKRVLTYLGEIGCNDDIQTLDISDIFSRVNEFPIYPCTARILNLEWIDENTQYRMVLPSGVRLVSFYEYMELMVEYRYRTLKLLELC